MKEHFIITIVTENKKGLLNVVTAIFNKSNFDIENINISRTNVAGIIFITLEVLLPYAALQTTLRKLEKIIEVHSALSFTGNEARLRMVSLFKLSNEIKMDSIWGTLKKYKINITHTFENSIIIEKSGLEEEITELYNLLNGDYLLSFCKTALAYEKGLPNFSKDLCCTKPTVV